MSDSWICVGIWVDGKEVKLASDIHTMLEQSVVNSAQSVVDKVSDEMESRILATGTNVIQTDKRDRKHLQKELVPGSWLELWSMQIHRLGL